MDALFDPRSVAVAGASPDLAKPGGRCLSFLERFGYGGRVYPINPRYQEIGTHRCYPDLAAIGEPVDLLILIVPAAAVPEYVREAARVGVRAAIVCSSGFSETGPEGAALEEEVRVAARAGEIALVGPNSLGLLHLGSNLAATFSTALQHDLELRPGPIAFVSQSGAMGAAILALAQSEGIPTGTFVSTGNETVLDFADLLEQLAARDDVSVVLGYIEGIDDGRRLVAAALAARERGTVVAVLKSGTSAAGRAAAQSHTGSMTGSAEAYDAAFRRAGILSAASPRELLDTAVVVASGRAAAGNRVGIVSMSGGAGVMMADRCGEVGLHVRELSSATRARLSELLPAYAGMRNPVDLGGVYSDPAAIEACARIVAEDPDVDVLLVFMGLSPLLAGDIEGRLSRARDESGTPVVVAWLAGPPAGVPELRRLGVPAYEDPIRAVDAAGKLWEASRPLPAVERAAATGELLAERERRGTVMGELLAERARRGTVMGEREVRALLARYGVPILPERLATTPAEAVAAAVELGGPVAVKGEAAGIVHKSDLDAIRLDVEPPAAGEAFESVVAALRAAGTDPAAIAGAVVTPMAPPGLELLVGVKHDDQFGPLVVVGLGGIESEALDDVAVDLAPLDSAAADALLDRLRARDLLGPFRGREPRDREAVVDLLVAVSRFAVDAGPSLRELDLNPVVAYARGDGCCVLDGAAVLSEPDLRRASGEGASAPAAAAIGRGRDG